MGAARPNPATGVVRVPVALPDGAVARPVVYDVLGREVRRLPQTADVVVWDARDAAGRGVAPGRYFVRIEVGATAVTRSVTIAE